ncbi:MAG: TetR/AcrR family transcriptional regulator [Agathobacter sp.]
MKREEKNQQTRRRIMDSALAEFSAQGYGASSINTICSAQNISKGIVYHYFETKDVLFLACVKECFQRLTEYIRENMPKQDDTESGLEEYFAIRTRFFRFHPVYQRIFCEATISPPAHLRDEIQKCKQDFDNLNIQILEQLLMPFSLRTSISKDEIIETFRQFQDFINAHYQMGDNSDEAFEVHEEKCRKALNILLYGIIERKKTEND